MCFNFTCKHVVLVFSLFVYPHRTHEMSEKRFLYINGLVKDTIIQKIIIFVFTPELRI